MSILTGRRIFFLLDGIKKGMAVDESLKEYAWILKTSSLVNEYPHRECEVNSNMCFESSIPLLNMCPC